MIRTQIQLTEEQSRRLREAARRSGCSMAEAIRRSIDGYLELEETGSPALPSRLAANRVVGGFNSGRRDVAQKHDQHLDECYS